jgi:polysaccharide biosynthesis protein PslG
MPRLTQALRYGSVTDRRSIRSWIGRSLAVLLVAVVAVVLLGISRPVWSPLLFQVTGEESLFGQVRGTLEWLGSILRRQPETADWVPVDNAGVNPFGVNTFLEQEVEPHKRELSVQMIAAAGFHWIRQEFPWEDIEIHSQGDFQDRRHEPYRSAWAKYDHIVDLTEQYGLQIIARLSNPPTWCRSQGDAIGTQAPPDDLDDFGDFCEAVARRYRGRIRHYQIWNEPNIYPEWGQQPVDPEAYTELLKVGYTRIKAVCPECVILSGALAQTIPLGPRDLNDFLFMQRMYDAGAGEYFDILTMQGYGLWSGPTDRRMRPRVLNFSRPLYLREIMVRNGDADKPIWITEMNWNAPPADLSDKPFGSVTPEQQARYAVLAYQRAQEEWPWVGVVNIWFLKRASDAESGQAMYYFRLVEPDFTPMPVYEALKAYATQPPVVYPGVHQEDHWALRYSGDWETRREMQAQLGTAKYATGPSDASLEFTFAGSEVWLKAGPGAAAALVYRVDGGSERELAIEAGGEARLVSALPAGAHSLSIQASAGSLSIDSLTVRGGVTGASKLGIVVAAATGLAAILILAWLIRSRPWHERQRVR